MSSRRLRRAEERGFVRGVVAFALFLALPATLVGAARGEYIGTRAPYLLVGGFAAGMVGARHARRQAEREERRRADEGRDWGA